jgi:hypothetical protein
VLDLGCCYLGVHSSNSIDRSQMNWIYLSEPTMRSGKLLKA